MDARRIESFVLPSEADLQLLFARLNNEHFNGAAPDCRIAYNERFSNSAGRITYGRKPLLIELSPKHFRRHPEALEETLLHEMVHAWCYERFRDTGHGLRFRRKMRECGLGSIYHELGHAAPRRESSRRYILRCESCAFEVLRKRLPRKPASCPRCNHRRFDPRFPLSIYEVVELRAASETVNATAASATRPRRPCLRRTPRCIL
ncbi:MAG TPA: SprT-like domain-containing protein [Candidatus Tyrphobacter sp.]